MRAPKNRRVFVAGYAAATPLGKMFETTWERAAKGEAGFRPVSRFEMDSPSPIVGEIPDWDPAEFSNAKEAANWNADFVLLTMYVCGEALKHAGIEMQGDVARSTACLIGSSLNGADAVQPLSNEGLNFGCDPHARAFLTGFSKEN